MKSMTMTHLQGVGLGFRPLWFGELMKPTSDVSPDWLEIISENYMMGGGRPRRHLEAIRARGPVSMHGVAMDIGGFSPLRRDYLKKLRDLLNALDPAFVSDHLCWTSSSRGLTSHDLLPLVYTPAEMRRIAGRIQEVQDFLGRAIHLENPSAYVKVVAETAVDEAEFLAELAARTGCGILLDVNNLYVNQRNLGIDPIRWLQRFRKEQICYVHVAGHTESDGVLIDTHDKPVHEDVWGLLAETLRLFPNLGCMIEWDDELPSWQQIVDHMARLRRMINDAGARALQSPVLGPMAADASTVLLVQDRACGAEEARVIQERFFASLVGPVSDSRKSSEFGVKEEFLEQLDSRTPTPAARGLEVYQNAWLSRLAAVAGQIFPALRALVKDELWEDFCADFLKWQPPQSWSVRDFGAGLADWVRSDICRWDFGIQPDLIAALVDWEWQKEILFDLPSSEDALRVQDLARLEPEALAGAVLTVRECVHLATWPLDVMAFSAMLLDPGAPRVRPQRVATTVLMVRSACGDVDSYIVNGRGIAEALFAGQSFASACIDGPELAAQLLLKFTEWGVFAKSSLEPKPEAHVDALLDSQITSGSGPSHEVASLTPLS